MDSLPSFVLNWNESVQMKEQWNGRQIDSGDDT